MGEIGARLVEPDDAIAPCQFAAAQLAQLRQHVPDPVAALGTGAQFLERPRVVALLGLDEARQVEGVLRTHGRGGCPAVSTPIGVLSGSALSVAKSGLWVSESSGICA